MDYEKNIGGSVRCAAVCLCSVRPPARRKTLKDPAGASSDSGAGIAVQEKSGAPDGQEESALIENIGLIMIDGKLYYNTGEESAVDGRCGVMDGEIASSVGAEQTPMENDQSNFGTGYGYQRMSEDTVELLMDDRWIVFESVEKADGSSSLQ